MTNQEQYRDTGKLTNYHYGTEKDRLTEKRNKIEETNANKKQSPR